jgi:hypothetical protein
MRISRNESLSTVVGKVLEQELPDMATDTWSWSAQCGQCDWAIRVVGVNPWHRVAEHVRLTGHAVVTDRSRGTGGSYLHQIKWTGGEMGKGDDWH